MQDILINGSALRSSQSMSLANRPTLVFLHDSLGSIELWRDFPAALAEATQCNTLVYDRQGYGKSGPFTSPRAVNYLEQEAEVLAHLLAACGIQEAILFGHSDGGSIALLAAAKHPARIRGVITEGAHIFVEDITLAGIREAVVAYRTTNLPARLQKYHGEKTEAVFWAWADTWLRDDYRNWNIEAFLPRITCPVLVIQGEQDEYGTLAQVAGIVQQVAGEAHQLIIPGSGHTPHREAREVVLHQAAAFINELLAIRHS